MSDMLKLQLILLTDGITSKIINGELILDNYHCPQFIAEFIVRNFDKPCMKPCSKVKGETKVITIANTRSTVHKLLNMSSLTDLYSVVYYKEGNLQRAKLEKK